jgi:hypothetical protein
MKVHGKSKIEFIPDNNLREKIPSLSKQKSYEFKTHKELDEFYSNIKSNCGTFPFDFKGEYELLKSFDRFFNFFSIFLIFKLFLIYF